MNPYRRRDENYMRWVTDEVIKVSGELFTSPLPRSLQLRPEIMGGEAQVVGAAYSEKHDARACHSSRQLASAGLASCHRPPVTEIMGEKRVELTRRQRCEFSHNPLFSTSNAEPLLSRDSVRPLPPHTETNTHRR